MNVLLFTVYLLVAFFLNGNNGEEKSHRQDDLVNMELQGFGPIVGKVEQTFSGKIVHAFRGLPYSKAKRFEDFAAPEPWTEPFDATAFGITCHDQAYENPDTSAECLRINVFTSNLDGDLAPVLFYIHGGGFVWGEGDGHDFTYFLEEDLVVVTFNYRLGSLGFLHSTDPAANITGNYGLKDQLSALRWVKQNIAQFGGNPDDVTIMGFSAGGASVDYMTLVAPESEGLVHKAISVSGSSTCPWAQQKNPQDNIVIFSRAVGCLGEGEEPSQSTYDCLRTKDQPTMMWSWSPVFQYWAGLPFVFVPSVDGFLLKDTPENLLSQGSFLHVPFLAGVCKDEGLLAAGDSLKSLDSMATLRDNWQTYCPYVFDMGTIDLADAQQACTEAWDYYMNLEPIDYQNYYQFMQMAGTRLFILAQQRSAVAHSAQAPYYGYLNEYQAARGSWAFYYNEVPQEIPRIASAIPHTDEWSMIFAHQQYPILPGDPDYWVHRFFIGTYLNFIKTGVPTIPADLDYDLEWPLFTPENQAVQVIDKFPRISTRFTPKDEEDFWNSVGL